MDENVVARIRKHAENSALEVCGALVGRADTITDAWPLVNHSTRPQHRFLIPAADVLRVGRAAEARGFSVVGFYHSHPHGAPIPSKTDLAQAVPGYTYWIVGASGELRAWRLRDDRSGFDEVGA